MKTNKLCMVFMVLFPLISNAQNDLQLITCDGFETSWNSIFGTGDTKEQTTKTYGIKNDKINMPGDCAIASATNILCTFIVGPGAVPDILEITYTVDLDRVSGRVVETQRFEESSEKIKKQLPQIIPLIGTDKIFYRELRFEGNCKKAKQQF